ncbi:MULTISPECIES: amidohydrolase [unclassified Nocardiopsis]|uniref:amidohydrolase n=1 Tax=Nocardiopsis TaxID=2013 RepID=UPI00387B0E1F
MSPSQLYENAAFFTAAGRPRAEAMVVRDGRIAYVGDRETAGRIAGPGHTAVDLGGGLVLPGFVDGHAHVLGTGEATRQADLAGAADFPEVARRIRAWAADHPGAPRVRATAWRHDAVDGRPTRQLLDALVPDRPVYVQAYDYHSIWVNTAALAELGIDRTTPDTPGGRIERDASGEPTGYIDETAMQQLVWPVLDALETDADRDAHLEAALAAYRSSGVTAAVDMGLNAADLAALERAEQAGTLTARIVGHWRIEHHGDTGRALEEVAHAARLAERYRSERLRVTGIKIMVDGTVDGCTAAMGAPFADGSHPGPIWDPKALDAVVAAADAAGLQVAMHAIGDEAVRLAIAAVEHATAANGPAPRRHRIEHLEVTAAEDVVRLGALGITASMQPVHADPAIQDNWRKQLGDERIERGFAWPEMTAAGAPLAFGTDSPTAPHAPLPNMFVAATRRSAQDPALAPNLEHYAVPLADAITHGTADAARACRAEDRFGRLAAGLHADFTVVDRDVFAGPAETLLRARVLRTVVGGADVWTG